MTTHHFHKPGAFVIIIIIVLASLVGFLQENDFNPVSVSDKQAPPLPEKPVFASDFDSHLRKEVKVYNEDAAFYRKGFIYQFGSTLCLNLDGVACMTPEDWFYKDIQMAFEEAGDAHLVLLPAFNDLNASISPFEPRVYVLSERVSILAESGKYGNGLTFLPTPRNYPYDDVYNYMQKLKEAE